MSKILVISKEYPSHEHPWKSVFVHELMKEFVLLGAEPTIISPESLTSWLLFRRNSKFSKFQYSYNGILINRPKYFSYSNKILPFGLSTYRWSVRSFCEAVVKFENNFKETFDLCYGHFLYPAGKAALLSGKRLKIPAIGALGESSFKHYEVHFGRERVSRDLNSFFRIIAVSNSIKEICTNSFNVPEDRIGVFPNGIDVNNFYPRCKKEVRKHLNLPEDKFIVAFVGHLDERKGPLRLMEAIKSIPEIKAIFLGSGPQVPQGSQVLFQGNVPHANVPDWLSAADIFVLPTLQEGCSNAIIEALACGLPVISSDLPFNQGIVNSDVGILVNPLDSLSLKNSICKLHEDNELRLQLGKNARQWAQKFSLQSRAKRILDWITQN